MNTSEVLESAVGKATKQVAHDSGIQPGTLYKWISGENKNCLEVFNNLGVVSILFAGSQNGISESSILGMLGTA